MGLCLPEETKPTVAAQGPINRSGQTRDGWARKPWGQKSLGARETSPICGATVGSGGVKWSRGSGDRQSQLQEGGEGASGAGGSHGLSREQIQKQLM